MPFLLGAYFWGVDFLEVGVFGAYPQLYRDFYSEGDSYLGAFGAGLPNRLGLGLGAVVKPSFGLLRVSFDNLGTSHLMSGAFYSQTGDSVFLGGSLALLSNSPGVFGKLGLYLSSGRGDVGFGLGWDTLPVVWSEMDRLMKGDFRWGLSFWGTWKATRLSAAVSFGYPWAFSLAARLNWDAEDGRAVVWPGLGVSYEERWSLGLSYETQNGDWVVRLRTGFGFSAPPKVAVRTVVETVYVEREVAQVEERKPKRHRRRAIRKPAQQSEAQEKPKASPEEIEALYLKGVEAYRWGEYKLAIQYWQEVLKLDPNNEKAKKGIARARKYLGN